ncbi:MAG: AAA family ATPase [Anaerolineae bacterium]|nr:AAA family ATPase [Anaerolineae bacterium]
MATIIAAACQKGGVGKTTNSTNLAAYLARLGKKVLFVDLDPQANGTAIFLGKVAAYAAEPDHKSIYHGLLMGEPVNKLIQKVPLRVWRQNDFQPTDKTIDIVPSHRNVDAAEVELAGEPQGEVRLRKLLRPALGKYDYIILDCPPSLGLLTLNALTVASHVIIPCDPGEFPLVGLVQLMKTIEFVRGDGDPEDALNRNLKIMGIVLSKADAYGATLRTYERLTEIYKDLILPNIPLRTIVKDSQEAYVDVFGFTGVDPANIPESANDFVKAIAAVGQEVMKREHK